MTLKTLDCPLCVDLDGTLIEEDVTQVSLRMYLKENLMRIGKVLFWSLKGRAFLKKKLGEIVFLDPASLSYALPVLDLIKEAKNKGHLIVLATAADARIAHKVAHYCGFFDHVIASDGCLNQRAEQKAETLVKTYGAQNFVYVGNSKDDLKVWPYAQKAIAVNVSPYVVRRLKKLKVPHEILTRKSFWLKGR